MRIVSPLLKKVLYPSMSAAGLFQRTSAAGLAIVTYHGVLPDGYERDPDLDGSLLGSNELHRQLRFLKAHYEIISPDDLLAWRRNGKGLPKRAVLLTCDDGLVNCLTRMLSVLQQEQVKCLFFVTGASAGGSRTMLWYEQLLVLFLRAKSGSVELVRSGLKIRGKLETREERKSAWWGVVKRLSQLNPNQREVILCDLAERLEYKDSAIAGRQQLFERFGLLDVVELRALASAGMTIGAHTMSHPYLPQVPAEIAFAEIRESREKLESALGAPVWAFAYPFGDAESVTEQIIAMPKEAGFEAAFLNYGGGLGADLPEFALPRIHVTAEMSQAELDAHVSGFYGRMQRRVGRRAQRFAVATAE